MTAEHLRSVIVEKQRPQCKGEPNAHAIANHLGAMSWFIYESDSPDVITDTLKCFTYDDIKNLRADATELILTLHKELKSEDWELYFGNRRRDFPPYLKVPKPT